MNWIIKILIASLASYSLQDIFLEMAVSRYFLWTSGYLSGLFVALLILAYENETKKEKDEQ